MSPAAQIVLALVAVAVLGCGLVRMVPPGSRGVVVRAGRVTRSHPPGPVMVLPVLERLELVSDRPTTLQPVVVTALTRDGIEARLSLSVLWQVVDPTLAVLAGTDPAFATEDAVERTVHRVVAQVELTELLRCRGTLVAQVPAAAESIAGPMGIRIVDADILDVDVRVGPGLLRLLA